MSIQTELLWKMDELGELTWKMLTHKLSISNMNYPSFYVSIDRLEKAGLIKKKKQGHFIASIQITSKGRKFLHRPVQKILRKDGLSTIVIFDIPEDKRRARESLRRYLLRHGYTLLQESVLIAPYMVSSELKSTLKELDIKQYVSLISGKVDYF